MNLSKFGKKFTAESGILQLMDDLGRALAEGEDTLMLGGGNPAIIPQVQACLREKAAGILNDPGQFQRLAGNYSPPQGDVEFVAALAGLLNRECGWTIRPENVALTNGSQTAFFYLFNMLAGEFEDGSYKKILLPLAPEYIGYADAGLSGDLFVANRPEIEFIDEHTFKYHIDFDAVNVTDDIAAICVSRPTNPTGNVLTQGEIARLSGLAKEHDIPLIIDNAYGLPFPNIMFTDTGPVWGENIILCMSLSKLGLPGGRTGIVIANEAVISAISAMNAIVSLSPGSMAAVLVEGLVKTGEIMYLSRQVIRPFYQNKLEQAMTWLKDEMGDLDYYAHKPEGTFFLWLWFRGMPITCQALYERLKERGVIIVPGHYFFPGLHEEWQHKHECIRVNYSGEGAVVREGIKIIAEEAKRAYAEG
ncbi:MAG: valine--pyruvate transaminase [Chloroflexi bacterium]|nr:valine--pyruvate transaminase [Chloroflexota bacterium]